MTITGQLCDFEDSHFLFLFTHQETGALAVQPRFLPSEKLLLFEPYQEQ